MEPMEAEDLLRERTLTSLEDVRQDLLLPLKRVPTVPEEAYMQQCQKLNAAITRVCLVQLSDARVRFCFYWPQDRQAAAFLKAAQLNPNLLELNLKENGFESRDKLRRLARLLADHGGIARLNLSRNYLAPGAFVELHSGLTGARSLVRLKLSRCGLADSDGVLLANFIARDKQLEYLNVSGNHLGSQTAAALSAALRSNACLIDLDLSWNIFTSANFVTLAADGLTANAELRRLNCSDNGVEDRGLAALLDAAAGDRSRLRVLELDNCRVTHLSADALVRSLRRVPRRLHAMKLNRNPTLREQDLLLVLAAVAAEPESQLALLEMNTLTRTRAVTEATPPRLRLTLRGEREVKVKMIERGAELTTDADQ